MEEKQQQRFLKLKNKIDALTAKRAAASDPEALAAIDAELAAARAKVKKARRVGGDGATKECAVCGAPTARTVSVKGATVYWCSMACQRVGWKAAKAGLPQPNQKKKLLSEKAPEPEKTYPTEAADEDLRIQPKMERLRPKTKEVDFGVPRPRRCSRVFDRDATSLPTCVVGRLRLHAAQDRRRRGPARGRGGLGDQRELLLLRAPAAPRAAKG